MRDLVADKPGDFPDHDPLDHFQEFRGRVCDEVDDAFDGGPENLRDVVHHLLRIFDAVEGEAVPESVEPGANSRDESA